MAKFQDWERAELLYEMGKSLREISRKLDLPISSLSRKAKGWKQGDLEQPIQAMAKGADILEQRVPPRLMSDVEQELDNRRVIVNSIQNLDKEAMQLHGIILKSTISKTKSGEITERDSSQIISTLGLSVDKVAARAGIGKEPTTAIQINNENNQERQITINYIGE